MLRRTTAVRLLCFVAARGDRSCHQPVVARVPPYAATPCLSPVVPLRFLGRRLQSSGGAEGGDEEGFVFDPVASITSDQTKDAQRHRIQALVLSLSGRSSPPTAADEIALHAKAVAKLEANPVNECIANDRIAITHVQNDAGEDMKLKVPVMSAEDARKFVDAEYPGMDLMQFADRDGVSYCRVRRALEELRTMLNPADESSGGKGGAASSESESASANKPVKVHSFRDAVNDHFVDWRSKQVVQEMQRGHPIKLTINQFVEPQSAVDKMREFMASVKAYAEQDPLNVVAHSYTGAHASEKELSIALKPGKPKSAPPSAPSTKKGPTAAPVTPTTASLVRHPSAQEWDGILARMLDACSKAGSHGTYKKNTQLKQRSLGMRTVRVDKYGRVLGHMDEGRPVSAGPPQ